VRLALLLVLAPLTASAAGKVLTTTGVLTAGGRVLAKGDALPDSEVSLSSGTAVLSIDGGRFLLKGPAKLTPKPSLFSLKLGSLLSVLDKRNRRFAVSTPTAVAAVRGTDFYVDAGPEGSNVCICKGRLDVSGQGLPRFPLASQHHLNRFLQAAGGKTTSAETPMVGHDDAELDALREMLKR
jgi:hypothetical protein